MKNTLILFLIIIILGFTPIAHSTAQDTTVEDLQALIDKLLLEAEALQARVESLKMEKKESETSEDKKDIVTEKQAVKSQITFTRTLRRGLSGKDVEGVQAYLAQFPDIYPEGLVTGYFGILTEKAIQRFQKKNDIVSSGTPASTGYGQAGPKTRSKINELITEGAGKSEVVPPGLPKAPGVQDSIDPVLLPKDEDITPPIISGVQSKEVTEVSATILWVTDENTTGTVRYDIATPISDTFSVTDMESRTDHTVVLPLLSPGTVYYYSVVASDDAGNKTNGDVKSFTTTVVEESSTEISDILGHWTFDETEGAVAFDDSGNGNDAELVNMSSSAWQGGKVGGALKFDGVDDYVIIPHSDILNIGATGESYTVSFWYNRSGIPNFERLILGKQPDAGPSPFIFRADQNSYVTFRITDGSKVSFITPPKTISGNGWNFIVGVRDTETNRIYVYINGEEGAGTGTEKGMSVLDTTIKTLQNDSPVWINHTKSGSLYYYDPFKIDEVTFYNRALSETEIKEIYDAEK